MASSLRGGIKQTGTGRILFWRGGGIWIGSAEESTGFHSHHAIQISLVLSKGTLRFRAQGEDWKQYTAVMIPAHHSHALEARGELVAIVFVEPESCEGQAIAAQCHQGITEVSGDAIVANVSALSNAYKDKVSDQDLILCARQLIVRLAATGQLPSAPVDKRILRAIELLHERLGKTISLNEIAEAVHLSPERFRHLFVEQTGIRFRPYVLWLRLANSVSAYASGASLTEASMIGGFADSAHFSRTFKRMFGATPVSFKVE